MVRILSDSTIVKFLRKHPPSYYIKVKNISKFQKLTLKSDLIFIPYCFTSGGYKWRLLVYLKGNEKDGGSGYISMYVEILNATPTKEVYARLTFSIYNKQKNKYFTIQDLEEKRFNTLKTIWGFAQVISLDTFNNPKSGYIFEGDECDFGVDVFVAQPPTKCATMSFNDISNGKFSWTVKNFFDLKENRYKSESFQIGGRSWFLCLYPKGHWLSIYLHLDDSEAEQVEEDEKISAKARLRLLHPSGSNHLTCPLIVGHEKLNDGWGFDEFVSIDELKKVYLDNEDNLNVEIEFEGVFTSNFSVSSKKDESHRS